MPSKVEDLKRKREEEEKKVLRLYFCKKDTNTFLKWWMSIDQYRLMLKVAISKSLKVAEMVARAVEINTENDRLKAQEKEAEAENGKHLKKRAELEKERYVCSS